MLLSIRLFQYWNPTVKLVDQGRSQIGIQGQVGNLQVVLGEVAFGQIEGAVALVIQAVVGLRGDREVGAVLGVDRVVEFAIQCDFQRMASE